MSGIAAFKKYWPFDEGGRVGYQPGGIILKKGARWFIKAIRKNLDDMLANHPRYEKIPNEEKDLLAQQFQTLIHELEAGGEVPKEALEAIYKNPQYYKTPRVQREYGDPDIVEVEELIKEKLLPDVSEELVNFETIGRKPNVSGGRVGYVPGGPVIKGAFKKFLDLVSIKASNEIRRGLGIWKDLTQEQKITQHDNFTKVVDNIIKTGKFDKKLNEYVGFDVEIAFLEAEGKAGGGKGIINYFKKKAAKKAADKKFMDDLDKTLFDEKGSLIPGAVDKQFAGMTKGFKTQLEGIKTGHQDNKILDAAYEDVAHHLKLEDLKYEADVLADSYANQLGKVYDDMADAERSELYGQSYSRLASNLKVQMDIEKIDQKVILGEFDVTGRKPNAFGGGVGSMFRGV